jgi:hypothetical protein
MARAASTKRVEISLLRIFSCRTASSEYQDEPEDQADRQQDLPGAAQVKIFPSLMPKPEPEFPKELIDTQHLTQQTPEDDDDQCNEEKVDPFRLAFWLPPSQCGSKK